MSQTLRSALEERVVAAVREGRDELVALAGDLVRFDTTARNVGDPPRQEAELQEFLRRRLATLGAETDVWEPEPTGSGNRVVPDGLDFVGRPQLAARLRGAGGGRSLLLNGHIDAVSAEPVGQWTSHPHEPEIRDGQLYGRGSCDMKGGIAGMLFALETVTRLGAKLAGDVVFCTNTDEESSGAGSYACAAHGVRADAGLCAEPTGFDVWVACRGGVNPVVRTIGRTGHAEMHHPHWREGGPVNAIDKMELVLASLRALREDWGAARRSSSTRTCTSRTCCRRSSRAASGWSPTRRPARPCSRSCTCRARCDGDRGGQDVFDEVEAWVKAADRPGRLAGRAPAGVGVAVRHRPGRGAGRRARS